MSYLIRRADKEIRSIPELVGVDDARLGETATNEDGDVYVMILSGWVKIYDHITGPVTPTIPLPPTQATVTDGEALVVPVTGTYATTATVAVVDGVVTGIVLS